MIDLLYNFTKHFDLLNSIIVLFKKNNYLAIQK